MTVTHLTPDESGRCRCCGKPPGELPLADQFTTDEKKRTCGTGFIVKRASQDEASVPQLPPTFRVKFADKEEVVELFGPSLPPPPTIPKTTSVGSSLACFQEVADAVAKMPQSKTYLVAVHVSAEYLERITPNIPQAPPGKYPVPPSSVEFHVNPALTGDQRLMEYSDGTMVREGFREVDQK